MRRYPKRWQDRRKQPGQSGFSLMELLVVMAIVLILVGLSIATTTSVLRATKINQAGTMLTSQLSLARQLAVSRNLPVSVRLIRGGTTNPVFSKMQLIQDGKPVTRVEDFPDTVGVATLDELTSLVDASPERVADSTVDPPIPPLGHAYRFVEFTFHPRGSLGLALTNQWFATVVPDRENVSEPTNFITVQIDPVTGALSIYKP